MMNFHNILKIPNKNLLNSTHNLNKFPLFKKFKLKNIKWFPLLNKMILLQLRFNKKIIWREYMSNLLIH